MKLSGQWYRDDALLLAVFFSVSLAVNLVAHGLRDDPQVATLHLYLSGLLCLLAVLFAWNSWRKSRAVGVLLVLFALGNVWSAWTTFAKAMG